MSQTIDDVPVTEVTTEFSGIINDLTGAVLASQAGVLLVVQVRPTAIDHVPAGDGFHRSNVVTVERMAAVPPELQQQAISLLAADLDDHQGASFYVDGEGGADADHAGPTLLEQVAGSAAQTVSSPPPSPVAEDPPAVAAPVPTAVDEDDDDDDFVLPPPVSEPEGQVTLRRIVPGDQRLRDFLDR
jgi:hypothetical protein